MTAAKPAGGTSELTWSADVGYQLAFTGVSDTLTVAIEGIPVPADGSIELCAGPLELDKLDLLFKAQVDVGGLAGQLHEARVSFGPRVAKLTCVIEEVESGELIDFECEAVWSAPSEAPESGGPRPVPFDDEDLDWEDDDTLEAMLGESPEAGSALKADEASPSEPADDVPQEVTPKGLEGLLKALLGGGSDLMEEALPEALASESSETLEEEPVLDPGDAHGLLDLMVQAGDLELEEGFSVDELVSGAAPIVGGNRPSSAKATALSNWLFQQDSVAELYLDDESLASLLEQW
jgi:hypothetical protein